MVPAPNDSSLPAQTITESSTVLPEYDVIIVGAGFSGISALHRMRKEGLKAHIFEGGSYWSVGYSRAFFS
jgi:ribulose 1,5-bisphosphate synthetase/thiazole synthase